MNPLNLCFTDNYKRPDLCDRQVRFLFYRKIEVQEVHRGSKHFRAISQYGSQEAHEGNRPTQFSKGGIYECRIAAISQDEGGNRTAAVHSSEVSGDSGGVRARFC